MLLIEATETLAQPWHIHHELPTGTFRVTAGEAVAVSNIGVGISYVRLAAT